MQIYTFFQKKCKSKKKNYTITGKKSISDCFFISPYIIPKDTFLTVVLHLFYTLKV